MNYPVVGILILLILLYVLLRVERIDIGDFFTTDGFTRIYNENSWTVILTIAVIVFVSYVIYTMLTKQMNRLMGNEQFNVLPKKRFMSFNDFYQTFIVSKSTNTIPSDKVMIFRTNINGINYYLVMDSMLEQNLPYRTMFINQDPKFADKAALCKIVTGNDTERYVCPVLLREDLLDSEYRNFVDRAFTDVKQAVDIKKALNIVEKRNVYIDTDSAKTEAQQVLGRDIYPRFIHHFNMVRRTPSFEPQTIFDIIDSVESETETPPIPNAYCYIMSGFVRDQLTNIVKFTTESPYILNLSANFSPFTILRQRDVVTIDPNVPEGTTKVIEYNTDIINDRKFVCGVQTLKSIKYCEFYATTVTPSIDQLDSVTTMNKPPSDLPSKSNDTFILTGRNNTDIEQLLPNVNLYVLGDFKNSNNVPFNNVKCWLARLDTYVDPNMTDVIEDESSPYYMKPKIYSVGIIPDDYKQCRTMPDNTIDSYCIGDTYINGVDYSDARRLNFEVATVKLNSI